MIDSVQRGDRDNQRVKDDVERGSGKGVYIYVCVRKSSKRAFSRFPSICLRRLLERITRFFNLSALVHDTARMFSKHPLSMRLTMTIIEDLGARTREGEESKIDKAALLIANVTEIPRKRRMRNFKIIAYFCAFRFTATKPQCNEGNALVHFSFSHKFCGHKYYIYDLVYFCDLDQNLHIYLIFLISTWSVSHKTIVFDVSLTYSRHFFRTASACRADGQL